MADGKVVRHILHRGIVHTFLQRGLQGGVRHVPDEKVWARAEADEERVGARREDGSGDKEEREAHHRNHVGRVVDKGWSTVCAHDS